MESVRKAFFVRGGEWGSRSSSFVWCVAGLIVYVRGEVVMDRMRLSLSQAGRCKEAALFGGAIVATSSTPGFDLPHHRVTLAGQR
jgi:hypothetical protein